MLWASASEVKLQSLPVKVKKCSSIAAVLADIVHRAILASMNERKMNERNPPKM
jgi:uncharacterized protein (DUF342 family)